MEKRLPSSDQVATAKSGNAPPDKAGSLQLTPQALRALAEAEERRRLAAEVETTRPREVHGRGGTEPVRFGDWEIKGLAVDF